MANQIPPTHSLPPGRRGAHRSSIEHAERHHRAGGVTTHAPITRHQLVATAAKLVTLINFLLVTALVTVRQRYVTMTTPTLIITLSRRRPPADVTVPVNGTLISLKNLATTYTTLRAQCDELDNKITDLVEVINPGVTQIFGCMVVTAAELIVSIGENPQRIRSQATLAHCGALHLFW